MSTLAADTTLDPARAQSRLRSYAGSALTRLRFQTALNALAFGATIAAWILPVLLFTDKLVSLKVMGVNVWVVWAGVSIMGIPFLLWRMFAPELHERRAAVMADERLGLNARLSSALTLDFHDPVTASFGDAFLGEATRKMAAVSVAQAFPIRFPRAFGWLLVPALAAAGIFFLMPNQDVLGVAAKAASKRKAEDVKKLTAETMEGKLEDLKKQLDDKKGEENGASYKVGQLMKEAEGIAKELKDDKKNTEEAMKAMVDLKKKIEDEKENIQRGKEFSERLEKLQNKDLNLEESDHTKAVSEALKAGDASLAAKEMRVAAQKIKDLLNDPKLSDEQKKKELEKLHKEMEKLASALAEDDAMRNKLQEISNTSMSAADFQKLEAEMKKAEERQNKNSNSKFGDAIEREMEEAANELERLEEENDTKLTEDEKEEIKELDAVEASLDEALQGLSEDNDTKMGPGAPNGNPGDKSGKNGKAAAGKGKLKSMSGGGRKPGQGGKDSSKSASGNQGGDNKGNPNGQPQNGPGGAGQGMGKRAYQDGDATFVPEKAKGELRAGAITGISHFRGQGAKGDAPQEFYKAFDPASKDGASSLEMERWPADRREMVKDYFTRVREGAVTLPSAPSAPNTAPEKSAAPVKEKLKE
ncbi:MAG: hypothetical protein WCT04_05540 [Planctomycetota bacterium]